MRLRLGVLIVVGVVFVTAQAHALTMDIPVTADALVYHVNPDVDGTNYGADEVLYSGWLGNGGEQWSMVQAFFTYLKFDLSALSEWGSVTKAEMRMYVFVVAYYDTNPHRFGVYSVADDSWQEMQVTWNTKPDYAPTPLSEQQLTKTGGSDLGWVSWDVTGKAGNQAAGDGLLSLALVPNAQDSQQYGRDLMWGWSKEHLVGGQPIYGPYLHVEGTEAGSAVPEPASLALLGLACGAIATMVKRRRKA